MPAKNMLSTHILITYIDYNKYLVSFCAHSRYTLYSQCENSCTDHVAKSQSGKVAQNNSAKYNDGTNYLLTIIDVFSLKALDYIFRIKINNKAYKPMILLRTRYPIVWNSSLDSAVVGIQCVVEQAESCAFNSYDLRNGYLSEWPLLGEYLSISRIGYSNTHNSSIARAMRRRNTMTMGDYLANGELQL
ncbi:hypothetical protein PROFUN_10224 [Planoprotostelium fungivorum]|uniref:Uncharacterized protein n=1 Tax=Planoprotostelium fungivorum TaxID=1890364 RepID=A0A2P6MQ69_9EUKA|nr:hypothetical protein PROFUN_10224 [Planoprotostelium fungivorum]